MSVILDSKGCIIISQTERVDDIMYSLRYVCGHIQVYDYNGIFLFSADCEQEVREELKCYAESAA